MSLTSQLRDGELSDWCTRRFTGSADVAARLVTATRGRRPVYPRGRTDARHWASIGGAFGTRLAALVQPAPPYYALHGLVSAGLVSREWADDQAARYPTHAGLPPGHRAGALDVRPAVDGWFDLDPENRSGRARGSRAELERLVDDVLSPGARRERHLPAEPVLADLFERTRAYCARHTPPGRLGTPGAEAGLARVCWLLDMFEDVYRGGRVPEPMHQVFRPGVPDVETMRGAASEAVVDELTRLAGQAEAHGALAEIRSMAGDPPGGRPLGIAGPVFVNHWADGDLLITGPGGTTLIDVKTVVRTDKQDRSVRWLWQLVAYAWLDIADRYRIRRVALYLARHGVLVSWSLDALADELLLASDRAGARAEFRALAGRLLVREGARLPGADADLPPGTAGHTG
ncbi:hypothetical protein ACFYT4_13130 [Streptomyces sp. NPDC004609]|uniref:hypothetical protein n=1 Tax=Streptomyces sp. NPDC004609 TaxID=3364704 RepID=UPI0036C45201